MRYESYDVAGAAVLMATVIVPLYEDVYADLLHNPFDSTEWVTATEPARVRDDRRLRRRRAGRPGARFTLPPETHWCHGPTTPVSAGFTTETGSRTFALCEIMRAEPWRRQRIARALHNVLMSGRAEERATLLVRQNNQAA